MPYIQHYGTIEQKVRFFSRNILLENVDWLKLGEVSKESFSCFFSLRGGGAQRLMANVLIVFHFFNFSLTSWLFGCEKQFQQYHPWMQRCVVWRRKLEHFETEFTCHLSKFNNGTHMFWSKPGAVPARHGCRRVCGEPGNHWAWCWQRYAGCSPKVFFIQPASCACKGC